jgi:chorismate synthase
MESITIREARDRADYDACVSLQRAVWDLADLEITSVIQLVATVHAGGLLLVADSAADGVVAFCYAFAALRGGEPHLHSDMLAVRKDARGHRLGARLKWAQREAALRRGLGLVTWTFDPMRAQNARLNLHDLGAEVAELLPNFYGATTSPLHHGLPTDRLLARWSLASPSVLARAGGETPPPASGAPLAYDVRWQEGRPVPQPLRPDLDGPRLLVEVPADWDAVCHADAALAGAWQAVVRAALTTYLGRGYAAVDLLVDVEGERRRPRYVLEKASVGG